MRRAGHQFYAYLTEIESTSWRFGHDPSQLTFLSNSSIQKPLRQVRTPNMNPILTRRALLRRISIIQQIAIHIVLEDKPTGIKPIIKDLTPHNMPPHPPAVLVPLVPQPIMTQNLGVEIMRLKARVVDVALGAFEEEETVVIDELGAAVEAAEGVEVSAGGIVNQLAREEIEARGVEFEGFSEVSDADAEVTEFIYGSWGLFEALECVWWAGLFFRLFGRKSVMRSRCNR